MKFLCILQTTYADVLRADLVVVSVQFLITNKCYTDLPHGDDAVAGFRLLVKKPGLNLYPNLFVNELIKQKESLLKLTLGVLM